MSDGRPARRKRIFAEDRNDIVIVHFIDKKILDEQNIQMIGEDLFRLVDELQRTRIIIHFGNVEFFSCAALGKLLTLNRKIGAARGKLVFCGVCSEVMEVFLVTKLDKLFDIAVNEEGALERFVS